MRVSITEKERFQALREQVIRQFGPLDVPVKNAVVRPGGSFVSRTPEILELSARGNMVGLFTMCEDFVPELVKRGRGSIINISSIYGVVASDPTQYEEHSLKPPADYNFVKAGILNLTCYLANLYGKNGVRVNSISPGGHQSDDLPRSFVENYTLRCSLGRMLRDDDKGAVVFLASDAAADNTGTNLMVHGGWNAP